MRRVSEFVGRALVSGALIVLPAYLATLLMLKAMRSVAALARPLAALYPHGGSQAAEHAVALLLLLMVCFVCGIAIQSRPGRWARERIESAILVKMPSYALVRDLTQQLAGQGHETAWKPALVEMGGGLVLAFIIEELRDGRYTVFVPAVPSPVRGAVYILPRERVQPLDVSFARTLKALTRWGSGMRDLMDTTESSTARDEAEATRVTRRAS